MNENSMAVTATAAAALTPDQAKHLAVIEYRIHEHMQNAAGHLLGVGQCLNEAKASGLVPHGEWEDWVARNTGFTLRQAQRMMSAARQVPEGSAMAQLPFTKIQACLQLPSSEDREAMAKRATDEDMTLRQLQEEVKKANQRAEHAEAKRKEAETNLTIHSKQATQECMKLRAQLNDAKARAAHAATQGISPEAQEKIDQLRAELGDAEAMIERQAELRQKAQQELLNYQAQAARGDIQQNSNGMTPDELAEAVRAFVGAAGVLPHMGMILAQTPDAAKREMWAYVDMVAEWVEGARRALETRLVE